MKPAVINGKKNMCLAQILPAAATEAGTIRGYEGTRPTTTACAGELTILRNIYMMETNHLYAQSMAGTFHKQMDNTHMEVAVEYLD